MTTDKSVSVAKATSTDKSAQAEETLADLRNIGIMAHIDAGKTTVTERILYYTGRVHRMGEVDEGSATMDWMEQEQERGITITSAATTFEWNNKKVNLIDTPGHVDFTIEVERSLRVLDGAVLVLSSVEGVQPQTETVWRQADRYHVPRIAFINKLDRMGANFQNTLDDIETKLGAVVLPLQVPIGLEDELVGVVDVIGGKGLIYSSEDLGATFEMVEVPELAVSDMEEKRSLLLETLADLDDVFAEAYLNGVPATDEILGAIRRCTIANKAVPVLCGSALKNKGIQPLLDAICTFLPSPLDMPPVGGVHPRRDKKLIRNSDPKEPFAGLVFKVQTDSYVGRVSYVRIYSGEIKTPSHIYNANKDCTERITKLMQMHANKRNVLEEGSAGDIVAVVGLKKSTTGDTLCTKSHPIVLEQISIPEPVIFVSVEPYTMADYEKLMVSLGKLSQEDPTFLTKQDEETGQTLISGMGELHLEVLIERLKREFGMRVRSGNPQVSYRETITAPVGRVEGKYVHQSGGRGQYGHVFLAMEPGERGQGNSFKNALKGHVLRKEFIEAVEEGVMDALESGELAGYQVRDVKATLIDGSYHEVDSTEVAFRIAASLAIRKGLAQGKPVLLEPCMAVEVIVPTEYLGEVLGDLHARRADVRGMDVKNFPGGKAIQILRAMAPLSAMFGYMTSLRSLTQGRGTYTMEFSHYTEVPTSISNRILGHVA